MKCSKKYTKKYTGPFLEDCALQFLFRIVPVAELMLSKFLRPVDLLCVKRACRHCHDYRRIDKAVTRRVILSLYRQAGGLFPFEGEKSWQVQTILSFCGDQNLIAGSAITQALLDEDWGESDIDIFSIMEPCILQEECQELSWRFNQSVDSRALKEWLGIEKWMYQHEHDDPDIKHNFYHTQREDYHFEFSACFRIREPCYFIEKPSTTITTPQACEFLEKRVRSNTGYKYFRDIPFASWKRMHGQSIIDVVYVGPRVSSRRKKSKNNKDEDSFSNMAIRTWERILERFDITACMVAFSPKTGVAVHDLERLVKKRTKWIKRDKYLPELAMKRILKYENRGFRFTSHSAKKIVKNDLLLVKEHHEPIS